MGHWSRTSAWQWFGNYSRIAVTLGGLPGEAEGRGSVDKNIIPVTRGKCSGALMMLLVWVLSIYQPRIDMIIVA